MDKKLSKHKDFEPTGRGNLILKFNDFSISYNSDPCRYINFFASDDKSDETALIKDDKFYILNGDFRETFKQLALKGGWDACYKYYQLRKDAIGSSWSTK